VPSWKRGRGPTTSKRVLVRNVFGSDIYSCLVRAVVKSGVSDKSQAFRHRPVQEAVQECIGNSEVIWPRLQP
jgi:hypothetical protein